MSLTPSDVASLSKSLSRWELAEYISTGLVTIACAGEYVADFTTWFTGGVRERKEKLAKASTLLLIVSLSLELVCLVRTNSLSGMLIGSLNELAGEADNKARRAIRDSGIALAQAGEATVKAAAAEGSVERAANAASRAHKLANQANLQAGKALALAGEVGYLISARHVEDQDTLVAKLRQFKRLPVILRSYSGDPEGGTLCRDLLSATKKAEMNSVDQCERWPATVPTFTGIAVQGPDDKVMESLGNILGWTRYLGGASSGPFGKTPHSLDLVIFVGFKHHFWLGSPQAKTPAKKQSNKQPPKP